VNAPAFTVELAPGAVGKLVIVQHRYANRPSLSLPW
jgi:hypothetical protein